MTNIMKKIFISALLVSSLGMIGCGSRQSSEDMYTDIPSGQVGSGVNYSDFQDVTPTIPSNLFDQTTAQDTAPSSNSTAYTPINQWQTGCLTNDNIFMGGMSSLYGGGSSSACFMPSSSGWDQNAQFALALGQFAGADQVLQAVLSMDPKSTDANANLMAMNFAELILVRWARYQITTQMGVGNWNQNQWNSYNTTNNQLYNWMTSINIQGY